MDWKLKHFSADIPQRKIERTQRVLFLAARRIEKRTRHILPETFDVLRILADEASRALIQGVGKSTFPDAGNPRVGFNRDHHVGLIEQRIGPWRRVGADPRDLHFWQRGQNQRQMGEGCR